MKVSDTLVPNGDVHSFRPSADGRRVFYLADQEQVGVVELYQVLAAPRRERAGESAAPR